MDVGELFILGKAIYVLPIFVGDVLVAKTGNGDFLIDNGVARLVKIAILRLGL